jgi:hypothetical protein
MVSITDTKCSSRARRAIGGTEEKWWRTQSGSNPSPLPKFPANREKNREFHRIRTFGAILKADTRANSKASSEIPYAAKQGIISAEQGILAQEQRI